MQAKQQQSDKPELQQRMQKDLGLSDDDFAYYATDLYVTATPKVIRWLKQNYRHPNNISTFVSPRDSNWNGAGRLCLDIPFAGKWPQQNLLDN